VKTLAADIPTLDLVTWVQNPHLTV